MRGSLRPRERMKQQRFSASLRDAGSVRSISRESRACRHRFSERFPERNSRWVRRARRQKHIPQLEEQHRRRGSEHASSAWGTYEGPADQLRATAIHGIRVKPCTGENTGTTKLKTPRSQRNRMEWRRRGNGRRQRPNAFVAQHVGQKSARGISQIDTRAAADDC